MRVLALDMQDGVDGLLQLAFMHLSLQSEHFDACVECLASIALVSGTHIDAAQVRKLASYVVQLRPSIRAAIEVK